MFELHAHKYAHLHARTQSHPITHPLTLTMPKAIRRNVEERAAVATAATKEAMKAAQQQVKTRRGCSFCQNSEGKPHRLSRKGVITCPKLLDHLKSTGMTQAQYWQEQGGGNTSR